MQTQLGLSGRRAAAELDQRLSAGRPTLRLGTFAWMRRESTGAHFTLKLAKFRHDERGWRPAQIPPRALITQVAAPSRA